MTGLGRPAPRASWLTASALALVVTAALLSASPAASTSKPVHGDAAASHVRAASCSQPALFGPVTCAFGFTGGEQAFDVPDGVHTLTVVAVGADGGTAPWSTVPRGLGTVVSGPVDVEPGKPVYVEVGGRGSGAQTGTYTAQPGGFNGGAAGGTGIPNALVGGPGGGGASDVRTVPRSDPGSLDSRLIVAAGGGGSSAEAGGGGGNGGEPGTATVTGAVGGGAGTETAGGAGGIATIPFTLSGDPGSVGEGGAGANGYLDIFTRLGETGGGGGGGLYGGGGGSGRAGGGGGSSYGGTVTPKPEAAPGSVTLTYTPAGPPASLELVDPTVTRARVGKPYRGFTAYAYNGDGWSLADVTDLVTVRTSEGTVCAPEGCVFTTPGRQTLVVGFDGVTARLTITVYGQARLLATAGDHQRAPAGRRFAHRLRAVWLDRAGAPVAGGTVRFRVTTGAAHFAPSGRSATVTTRANGVTAAPRLVAGRRPGKVVVSATSGRLHATYRLRVVRSAAGAGRIAWRPDPPTATFLR